MHIIEITPEQAQIIADQLDGVGRLHTKVRFAFDTDGVKVKVGEGVWSPGFRAEQVTFGSRPVVPADDELAIARAVGVAPDDDEPWGIVRDVDPRSKLVKAGTLVAGDTMVDANGDLEVVAVDEAGSGVKVAVMGADDFVAHWTFDVEDLVRIR